MGTVVFRLLLTLLLVSCGREPRQASVVAPPQKTEAAEGTIVAFGDSLTAGYGLSVDEAWPALLEKRLQAEGRNWRVMNAGVSGETSSGALARVDWVIRQLRPDIVIVGTGGNDGLRGLDPDHMRSNVTSIVRTFQKNGATVVLAGMRIVQNMGPEYAGKFAAVYPAIARETGALLIPFLLEGVAGDPSLNLEDGIHPNAAGCRVVMETVYPHVLKAITMHR